LANQARRLADLLALRQPGSEQYFWCFAFRASARNNAPQNRQLWSSDRAIADPPCAEYCGATARCHAHYEQIHKERKRRKKKTKERGRRSKKSLQLEFVKENPRRKSTTFKPPSSGDFQNAADS
jgi:hypothetical protein